MVGGGAAAEKIVFDLQKDVVIKPKVIKPKVIKPKVIKPKVIKPKVIKPKVIKPKVIKPKVIKPKVIKPKYITNYRLTPEEQEFKRMEYVHDLFNIMGYTFHEGLTIPFEDFRSESLANKFKQKIPELKQVFSSDKLTALHKGAVKEQEYFTSNLIRQLLKEIGYNLKSLAKSDGYIHGKKQFKRYYVVEKMGTVEAKKYKKK